MNIQPIEKRIRNDGSVLDVYSIFGPTFQGEGPFVGTPCVFVRLAGCNLQCPGCDTLYSDPLIRQMLTIDNIVKQVKAINTGKLVVISGGEPFRQPLGKLFTALLNEDFFVQVETNGTLPPSFEDDERTPLSYNSQPDECKGVYIVCSPKSPKVNELTQHLACCYKYVLDHRDVDPIDGLPISVLGTKYRRGEKVWRPDNKRKPIYLQPMDHKESLQDIKVPASVLFPRVYMEEIIRAMNRASLNAVKESCIKYGYILGIQIHKIIGVE